MTVHLVGAGPGDPGLITVRGAELLRRAQAVVHDRLSASELLDLVPAGAEIHHVGKTPRGEGSSPSGPTQEEINRLLVELGRRWDCVVRLKGGDPFVFARGGEEAAALEAAGVAWEVVPGVTSAVAAPAYAGIPVTLRHSATSLTILAGHEDPAKGAEGVAWEHAARLGGTLVVLMGAARRAEIAARLMAGGLAGDTAVAAVTWGTRARQREVRTTLAELGSAAVRSPATIVIGEVAGVSLDWRRHLPLAGVRVVVTRAREQAEDTIDALRELGAEVATLPTITIVDPPDGGAALGRAAAKIGVYDWAVVTSANGARRLLAAVGDARRWAGVRVAAVGPATAAALLAGGIVADLVPERRVGDALVEAFPDPGPAGGRVLFARAEVGREEIPAGLGARGWTVDVVAAYRTAPLPATSRGAAALADADVILFTSGSTVSSFLAAYGADAAPPIVACIGPVTARVAHRSGLEVAIEASEHTLRGLVSELADHVVRARSPR